MILRSNFAKPLLLVLATSFVGSAMAADLPKPTGTVLLTIVGKIGKTNR